MVLGVLAALAVPALSAVVERSQSSVLERELEALARGTAALAALDGDLTASTLAELVNGDAPANPSPGELVVVEQGGYLGVATDASHVGEGKVGYLIVGATGGTARVVDGELALQAAGDVEDDKLTGTAALCFYGLGGDCATLGEGAGLVGAGTMLPPSFFSSSEQGGTETEAGVEAIPGPVDQWTLATTLSFPNLVYNQAFTPDGATMVVGARLPDVGSRIYDITAPDPANWTVVPNSDIAVPQQSAALGHSTTGAAFTPDGSSLVMTYFSSDGVGVAVADTRSPDPADWQLRSTPGLALGVSPRSATFTADGTALALGSVNTLAFVDSSASDPGSWTQTNASSPGTIHASAFNADETVLAFAHGFNGAPSSSNGVTFVDSSSTNPADWTTIGSYTLPGTAYALAFAADSSHLAVAHAGGTGLTVLNTSEADQGSWSQVTTPVSLPGSGYSLEFSANGDLLAVGHDGDNHVTLVDPANPDPAQWTVVPSSHVSVPATVRSVAFTLDQRALTVGYNGGVAVFDTAQTP